MTDSVTPVPEDAAPTPPASSTDSGPADKILIITPEGMSVTDAEGTTGAQIHEPGKVMRIGSMVKQLLEEVKAAPLDEAARARMATIHDKSIAELKTVLAPELAEELSSIALPFQDSTTPSDAELRIAQAQLVGWLEGLFHGIQSVLFAQQMMARAQIEQMRKSLPTGGTVDSPENGSTPGAQSGPYL